MKILIAEDNADDRRLLRLNLEHHGCEVIEASNGEIALEMARLQRPDLIISDILMPKMDGFEFIWGLKQTETTKNIPFIFYSAIYTGEKDKRLAMALGAETFIEKPEEPENLWLKISEIIEDCSARKGARLPDMEFIKKEEEFFKAYSHIVAIKLEEKVKELSDTKDKYNKLCSEFHALLDAIPDNLNLLSPDLKIIWANAATARNLGISSEEIVGKYCYTLWHNRTDPCPVCPVQKTFRTGRQGSNIVTTPDRRIWDLRAVPIKDETGQVINVIEVGRDITEQRKLEEQLRHAQKMEAIGTLAGGIAHDFNNMLNVIIGYGGLMQIHMKPDDPMMHQLKEILSAAEKATQLTKGLLLFSRKQTIEVKAVNINNIIERFKKMINRIIGEDIDLKIMPSKDDLIVMADATQIEQVLMNLATNARDAMPIGGTLTITADAVEIDEGFIKAHGFGEPGRYALITVSDTGIGMDEKIKERIFEPYFTTKEMGRGTGLGLAIVFGIVKQHNGYINCYSELGKGTTFRIYIPLIESTAEKFHEEEKFVLKGGTETILLAEDEESLRNLIGTILRKYGYSVIEAVDGEDAIEKFKDNRDRIQLLLSDLIMPKKNGREVYDDIKDIKQDIKAIFISGYSIDVMHGYGIKGVEFISKPVHPTTLLKKIREVLDKQL